MQRCIQQQLNWFNELLVQQKKVLTDYWRTPELREEMGGRDKTGDGCCLVQNEKCRNNKVSRAIIIYKRRLNDKIITIAMKAGGAEY
jgi:hypothetical protein